MFIYDKIALRHDNNKAIKQKQKQKKRIEKAINFIFIVFFIACSFFYVKNVNADTSSFYPNYDGSMNRLSTASWAGAHDSTNASYASNSDSSYSFISSENLSGTDFFISRGVINFDLNLPDCSIVDSAKIFIFVEDYNNTDNDGLDYITTTEANTSNPLFAQHYNYLYFNSTKLTNDFDFSGLATSSYISLDLNQAGIDYIQDNIYSDVSFLFQEGHDFEDSTIDSGLLNDVDIRFSEYASTEYDPYIEIIYTISTTTPTTTPATTTPAEFLGGGRLDTIYTFDDEGNIEYMEVPFLNYIVIVLVVFFSIFLACLIIN